jgi:diadenosine tetraphosphatase ApaH/serine/threonine PP2A family protein phosphatase
MLAGNYNVLALRALQWTSKHLSDESKAMLTSLPMMKRSENILFVHASPHSPELWDYILDAEDATLAIRHFNEKLCFIGHTHVPDIFSRQGRVKSITREEQFLINVGSVGQPRDGNPMLAFGIIDSSSWEYRLIRSDYNIQQAVEKIDASGLPKELGSRLMYGI